MEHFSDPRKIYLDVDFKKLKFRVRGPSLRPLWTVLRLVGLRPSSDVICYERTRRGWHVIIELPEKLKPAETVALQLALGSDPRREALNLMRVLGMRRNGVTRFWSSRWNILYSRKLKGSAKYA
jgi:hypothetical protein